MKLLTKSIQLFTIAILISGAALGQKFTSLKVTLNTGKLMKNLSSYSTSGTRIYKGDNGVLMAYKEGYVTYAAYMEDLFKADSIKDLNITLIPFQKPTFKGKLKKLAFTEFIDKTGKLIAYSYSGYPGYFVGIDLKDVEYSNAINKELRNQGFDVVDESSTVFKEKKQSVRLALAGEILTYNKETKGTPGFETQVIVKWSVFDADEEKVVLTIQTGGYTNTRTRQTEKEALALALSNSLDALIADTDFQKIAQIDNATETKQLERIEIPFVNKSGSTEYSEMIQNSIKSAVTIKTEHGHGSGFVVSSNGYILTNNHVISQAENIEIIFNNDLTLSATVVSKDKNRDVAILKVNGNGFKPLAIDTTDSKSKLGTDVIAIGTPEDIQLGQTVTKGIVSGFRVFNEHKYIQTDVSINAGNSGGALINKNGEVVGIIAAKIKGDNIEGLGFAIPIREALQALNIKFKSN